MSDFVFAFTDQAAQDIAVAGGKGSSLAKLTAAGFAVPAGLIVGAEAYRLFAAAAQDDLAGLADFDSGDRSGLTARSELLMAALSARPLAESVREALGKGLVDLGAEQSFAVRSSSTLEDLAEAAFAGQHDTFLNVSGTAQIEAKIAACYASLWSERAYLYRAERGFDHDDAAMAVVVQILVDAQTAGVAFSLNPLTGHPGQAVINANYGLGESVVSGESEVDQYVYNVTTRTLDECHIADTRLVMRADGASGTTSADAPGGAPCLTTPEIEAVAQLCVRAAEFYRQPQDIEWAYGPDGTLYLLQSRDVTQVPEFWTRDESAERFPNVITPLTWDLVQDGFHASLRHSLALMGLPPFDGLWFGLHDNYVYGNETVVRRYKAMTPELPEDIATLAGQLPSLLERYAWVVALPSMWSANLDHYLLELGRLQNLPLDALDEEALWDHVLEINDLGADYFLPNIAISMAHHLLTTVLKRLCQLTAGDTAKGEALFSLLLSVTESRTGQINRQLFALAQQVRGDAGLRALLESHPARDILDKGNLSDHPAFAAAFERFVGLFGSREVDFDPYHPTWGEAPSIVLDQIRVVAASEENFSPLEELQRRIKVRATESEFLAQIPQDIRPYAVGLLRLTRSYTELDDLEHFETSRLTPAIRRGLLALGSKLVERGIADTPSDIWFAHRAGLDATMSSSDGGVWADLAEEIARERNAYLANKLRTPNWILSEAEPAEVNGPAAGSLTGLPGSPGTAEGTVYLLLGPEDFAAFPDRAVLVARTTNPAWTPLFYSASAVITESGGPLSHGAVTARELGKPAVMAVRNVLSTLKSGDRVKVDGTAGKVYLLEE